MANILVVTGSVRPNSANSNVVPVVVQELEKREGVQVTVADLGELQLPFMEGNTAPSQPDYEITNPAAKKWAEMVVNADGVVFVMPEYNHSMSAVQKNAIDWLYAEWADKPVALVAYGFYEGKYTIAQFEEINTVIKTKLGAVKAGLQFGEELEFDGTPKDEAKLLEKLNATFDELLTTTKE